MRLFHAAGVGSNRSAARGYFRREWRLAVERTLDMVDDHLFLLPIAIDDTDQSAARVPEKFLAVQWLKFPKGARLRLRGPLPAHRGGRGGRIGPQTENHGTTGARPPTAPAYPEFPKEEPGQRVAFWAHVMRWAFQSARIGFRRLPWWVRVVALSWLGIVLLSRGCTPHHHEADRISSAAADKLKVIAGQYQGSSNAADIAKLGDQIAASSPRTTPTLRRRGGRSSPFHSRPPPATPPRRRSRIRSSRWCTAGSPSRTTAGGLGAEPPPRLRSEQRSRARTRQPCELCPVRRHRCGHTE